MLCLSLLAAALAISDESGSHCSPPLQVIAGAVVAVDDDDDGAGEWKVPNFARVPSLKIDEIAAEERILSIFLLLLRCQRER